MPSVPWLKRRSNPQLFADEGLGVTVTLTALVAVGLAVGGYFGLKAMHPSSGEQQAGDLDLVKALVAIAGFLGVVVGSVYAFRRHHLAAGDTIRANASLNSERYTAAATQLGSERAATRLAGVYAMARLADDWEEQQQTCIDVLCAYLRLPVGPDDAKAEREVRRTLVRVFRDHLRPGEHDDVERPDDWRGRNFSFEGAVFEKGDLSKAQFTGGKVSFHGVRFAPGTFDFSGVVFGGAEVWFTKTQFAGGRVTFKKATFSGGVVMFDRTVFRAGTVTFAEAKRTKACTVFKDVRVDSGIVVDWGPFALPPPGA